MISASQAASVARSVMDALLSEGAIRATKYLSERETVVAQRITYGGRIDKRERRTTIVVTFGEPNFKARDFIKKCKRAGEPFPVKKIQFKFPPKRRVKRR